MSSPDVPPAPMDAPEKPARVESGMAERIANRLPAFTGSIRFRLTAMYSLLLFGLAAIVVGGIYLALSHRLGSDSVSRDYVVVYQYGGTNPKLLASAQDMEHLANEHALETLRSTSFTALSMLFLTSLVVGWVVAGRVLAPIGRITSVAREIQATDLTRRINLPGPDDELRELADTFDEMLGRLDEAFEGQRRFIHEASHELRNPLAVIRANVDVALADPDLDAETMHEAIVVVQRAIERISRLVDDLLVYADRGAPVHDHSPVDVAGIAAAGAAEFRAPADARGVTVTSTSPDGLWVLGDAESLRRVLANLLANAVRLAPRGSEVSIAAGRSGDWVWLAVDDAGPGIDEGDREQVFTRFWRGDSGQARTDGRSGLGLTIVRQIVEAHRGTVRVLASTRGGSTFVVWLPATSADGGAPSAARDPLQAATSTPSATADSFH